MKLTELPDRFQNKIEIDEAGCWNWTACVQYGYGVVSINRVATGAHRAVYTLLVGEIPDGLTLDHLCLNKRCVNPEHLEPVTRGDNVRRWARTITACPAGHEYTPANTRVSTAGGKVSRFCKECERIRARNKWRTAHGIPLDAPRQSRWRPRAQRET